MLHDTRKLTIQNRIVAEVSAYYLKYKRGISMQILSAKYARALYDFGGFPESILELQKAGRIGVEIQPSGARRVLPVVASPPNENSAAYWF